MVVTLVRCAGRVLLLSASVQISIMNGLKYGYCKLSISDLTGMVEPEDFMRLIIRVISCYGGRDKLKGIFGSFNLRIQEGIVNTFMRFIRFSR